MIDPTLQVGPVAATWIAIQDVPNRDPGLDAKGNCPRRGGRAMIDP
jgi:hypothetical protein